MSRKPIFDTVRQMLGRGFHSAEIAMLDHAIDGAADHCSTDLSGPADDIRPAKPSGPAKPKNSVQPSAIGPAGTMLIKQFEGCAQLQRGGLIKAYPDPGTGGAPWTIGWGATGPDVTPATIWTQQQCDDRLETDLRHYAAQVSDAVGDTPTSQAQFDETYPLDIGR